MRKRLHGHQLVALMRWRTEASAAHHGISSQVSADRRIPRRHAGVTTICSENQRLNDRGAVDRTGRADGLSPSTRVT